MFITILSKPPRAFDDRFSISNEDKQSKSSKISSFGTQRWIELQKIG